MITRGASGRARAEREHMAQQNRGPVSYIGDRVDWVDAAGNNVTGTVAMSTDATHVVVWDDGSCTRIPKDATIRRA